MRQTRSILSAIALTSLAMTSHIALAQDTTKPTASATPAPVAPVTAPVPGIVVSGLLEVNYTANINKPISHQNSPGYLFNQKEGQFALNLAEIQIAKAATSDSRAGFTVKLIEGEVKRLNFILEDASTSNVLEAYGTLLIPIGKRELKFDAGQFETHVGYETIEIGTNNFFSHNFLFAIPSPFYNAGVRASYPVSPKLTLNGYIYNRYNGRTDNANRDLAPGFQIAYTFSPKASFVLNALGSRENLDPSGAAATANSKQQTVLDAIYTLQTNAKTRFVAEGLYRTGKDLANNSYDFYGFAGYGIFGPIGLRAEYLTDSKNNFILGADPNDPNKKVNLGSVTLSFEPKTGLFPNTRTILEARYDYSNAKEFSDKDNINGKKNQTTITIGQVYSF